MPRPIRLFALASAVSLLAPALVLAQNPVSVSSSTGHINSRFIPLETLQRMRERPEGVADSVLIPGSVDSVWAALKTVLAKRDIPVGFEDRSIWQIGHAQAKVYRQLGKNSVSTYLRCGDGPTGPNADNYVVYLSFLAQLVPAKAGGTVSLFTLLTGRAVDLAGGRNDPIDCSTTGRLEVQLGKDVAKVLGTNPS
jgi:hypothetical protein